MNTFISSIRKYKDKLRCLQGETVGPLNGQKVLLIVITAQTRTPKLLLYPLCVDCVPPNKKFTQIVPTGKKIALETEVSISF
jgi:hypothetical protein